jgi:polysaccharide pyruvyl transferase WcaK-like protein
VTTPKTMRVGVFGLLGSGNLGNDGSLEAVLNFVRDRYPDAVISALCGGPDEVRGRYGITATRLHWYRAEYRTASGVARIALKGMGKLIDVFRTAAWVRRQDVVIVPGMGVLEATLPLRPWGFPYSLFLLSALGRLFGAKVALVCVGADMISNRATRWLVTRAARLAAYRSYRDTLSRDAMAMMGVDTTDDAVYPDLAFALPVPQDIEPAPGTVGVGVMAYYGGNEDRDRADEIYRTYVDRMTHFVGWLLDRGRDVRLFIGDQLDRVVVDEILDDVRIRRPDLDRARVRPASAATLHEVMGELAAVDSVVATRYHNVLCALKLSKPTVSLGYAAKNDTLMAGMGLAEFCQFVHSIDVERLIEQFTALERRSAELHETLVARNLANVHSLDQQFAELSARLMSPVRRAPAARDRVRQGAR